MSNEMARRTKVKIAEMLVKFLEKQEKGQPFYKSKLLEQEIVKNTKLAEEWMDLYIVFQNGPRVRKIELERNVLYEVLGDGEAD